MLVASFSGLYCTVTHLHVYQCQLASLMNIQQLYFYPCHSVSWRWSLNQIVFIEPLLYFIIFTLTTLGLGGCSYYTLLYLSSTIPQTWRPVLPPFPFQNPTVQIMHAPSGDRSTEIEIVLLSDQCSTSKPPRLSSGNRNQGCADL